MDKRLCATLLLVLVLPLVNDSAGRGGLPGAQQAVGARGPAGKDPTARAVAAAQAFLAALDDAKRSKASVSFTTEFKTRWSNLPTGVTMQSGATERSGVKLGDMSPSQQEAALALVASTLSPAGYRKVMNIVTADEVLEKASAPKRAPESRIR